MGEYTQRLKEAAQKVPQDSPVQIAGSSRNVEVIRSASILDIHPYYREAAIKGSWDYFNPPEDMAMTAYKEQVEDSGFSGAAWSTFKSSFNHMWDNWWKEATYNLDSGQAKFVKDLGEQIPEFEERRKKIYMNPLTEHSDTRFITNDYMAMQIGNMGSTAAMFAGMGIEQAALWLATAPLSATTGVGGVITSIGKLGQQWLKVAKLMRAAKNANVVRRLSSTSLAVYSGVREAYINGLEVGQEVFTEMLDKGIDEPEALKLAQQAVHMQTVREGWVTGTMNALQWGLLGLMPSIKGFKAGTKGFKGATSKLAGNILGDTNSKFLNFSWGVSGIITQPFEHLIGKVGSKLGQHGIRIAGSMISEGLEEGYQNVVSNWVHRDILKQEGMAYEHIKLIDQQTIDEMIGGMLGGLMFGGVGSIAKVVQDVRGKSKVAEKEAMQKKALEEVRRFTSKSAAEVLANLGTLTKRYSTLIDEHNELVNDTKLGSDEAKLNRLIEVKTEIATIEEEFKEAEDFNVANLALQSLIADIKLDKKESSFVGQVHANLLSVQAALEEYQNEYNKWNDNGRTGVSPFHESQLEGKDTLKEAIRILKSQNILDSNNLIINSEYLEEGVSIYDEHIKVFEKTITDFMDFFENHNSDVNMAIDYAMNELKLGRYVKQIEKLKAKRDANQSELDRLENFHQAELDDLTNLHENDRATFNKNAAENIKKMDSLKKTIRQIQRLKTEKEALKAKLNEFEELHQNDRAVFDKDATINRMQMNALEEQIKKLQTRLDEYSKKPSQELEESVKENLKELEELQKKHNEAEQKSKDLKDVTKFNEWYKNFKFKNYNSSEAVKLSKKELGQLAKELEELATTDEEKLKAKNARGLYEKKVESESKKGKAEAKKTAEQTAIEKELGTMPTIFADDTEIKDDIEELPTEESDPHENTTIVRQQEIEDAQRGLSIEIQNLIDESNNLIIQINKLIAKGHIPKNYPKLVELRKKLEEKFNTIAKNNDSTLGNIVANIQLKIHEVATFINSKNEQVDTNATSKEVNPSNNLHHDLSRKLENLIVAKLIEKGLTEEQIRKHLHTVLHNHKVKVDGVEKIVDIVNTYFLHNQPELWKSITARIEKILEDEGLLKKETPQTQEGTQTQETIPDIEGEESGFMTRKNFRINAEKELNLYSDPATDNSFYNSTHGPKLRKTPKGGWTGYCSKMQLINSCRELMGEIKGRRKSELGETFQGILFEDFLQICSEYEGLPYIKQYAQFYADMWNLITGRRDDNAVLLSKVDEFIKTYKPEVQTVKPTTTKTGETKTGETKGTFVVEKGGSVDDMTVVRNNKTPGNNQRTVTSLSFYFSDFDNNEWEEVKDENGRTTHLRHKTDNRLTNELDGGFFALDSKFWSETMNKNAKNGKKTSLKPVLPSMEYLETQSAVIYKYESVNKKKGVKYKTWIDYFTEIGVTKTNISLFLSALADGSFKNMDTRLKEQFELFVKNVPIILQYNNGTENLTVGSLRGVNQLYQIDSVDYNERAVQEKLYAQRMAIFTGVGEINITEYIPQYPHAKEKSSLETLWKTLKDNNIPFSFSTKVRSLKNTDSVHYIKEYQKDRTEYPDGVPHIVVEDGKAYIDGKLKTVYRCIPITIAENERTKENKKGYIDTYKNVYNYIKYATIFTTISQFDTSKFTDDDYKALHELLQWLPDLNSIGIANKTLTLKQLKSKEVMNNLMTSIKNFNSNVMGINTINDFVSENSTGSGKVEAFLRRGYINDGKGGKSLFSQAKHISNAFFKMSGDKTPAKMCKGLGFIFNVPSSVMHSWLEQFQLSVTVTNNTVSRVTFADITDDNGVFTVGEKQLDYLTDYINKYTSTYTIQEFQGVNKNTSHTIGTQPMMTYEVVSKVDGKTIINNIGQIYNTPPPENKPKEIREGVVENELGQEVDKVASQELTNFDNIDEAVKNINFEEFDSEIFDDENLKIVISGKSVTRETVRTALENRGMNANEIDIYMEYIVLQNTDDSNITITKESISRRNLRVAVPAITENLQSFANGLYNLQGISSIDQDNLVQHLIPIVLREYVKGNKFRDLKLSKLREIVDKTVRNYIASEKNRLETELAKAKEEKNGRLFMATKVYLENFNLLTEDNIKLLAGKDGLMIKLLNQRLGVNLIEDTQDTVMTKSQEQFHKSSLERTGIQSLSTVAKMIFSSVEMLDKNGVVQKNKFGLTKYEDSQYVYDCLLDEAVHTTNNIQHLIDVIKDKNGHDSDRKRGIYVQLANGEGTGILQLAAKNDKKSVMSKQMLNELMTKIHLNKAEMLLVYIKEYMNYDRDSDTMVKSTKAKLYNAAMDDFSVARKRQMNNNFYNQHVKTTIHLDKQTLVWNIAELEETKKRLDELQKLYSAKGVRVRNENMHEIKILLSRIGLKLSDSTLNNDNVIKSLFDVTDNSGLGKFIANESNTGFIDKIKAYKNEEGKEFGFALINESKMQVLENASKAFKSVIDVEAANEGFDITPSYIDGKILSGTVQTMKIYDEIKKLRMSQDTSLYRDDTRKHENGTPFSYYDILQEMATTNNNHILKICKSLTDRGDSAKGILDLFELVYLPPSVIFNGNTKENGGAIDQISAQEFLLTVFAHQRQFSKLMDYTIDGTSYNFREGSVFLPPIADKGQMVATKMLLLNLTNADIEYGYDEVNMGRVTVNLGQNTIKLLTDQLFTSELKRMVALAQNEESLTSKTLSKNNFFFTTLRQFNNLEYKGKKLLTYLKDEINKGNTIKINEIVNTLSGQVNSIVSNHFQSQLDEFITVDTYKDGAGNTKYNIKGLLADNKIVYTENEIPVIKNLDGSFLKSRGMSFKESKGVNSTVVNTMISMLDTLINNTLGQKTLLDLTMSSATSFVKSVPNVKNTKLSWEQQVNQSYNEFNDNLKKRMAEMIAPGLKYINSEYYYNNNIDNESTTQINGKDISNRDMRVLEVRSRKSASDALKRLIEIYYPNTKIDYKTELNKFYTIQANIQLELNKTVPKQEAIDKLETELKVIEDALKQNFPIISAFLTIDATDGQTYCTYNEYLNFLYRMGKIDIAQYESFDKIMEDLSNGKELSDLTESQREDLDNLFINSLKTVYTGNTIEYNGDVAVAQKENYIKTSVFPLLPHFTKGNELDKVRKLLESKEKESLKEGILIPTLLCFDSAVKVGNNKNSVSFDTLVKEELSDEDNNKIDKSISTLPRSNYRLQQATDTHIQESLDKGQQSTVTEGVQQNTLKLGNGLAQRTTYDMPAENLVSLITTYNKQFKEGDKRRIEIRNKFITGESLNALDNWLHTKINEHDLNKLLRMLKGKAGLQERIREIREEIKELTFIEEGFANDIEGMEYAKQMSEPRIQELNEELDELTEELESLSDDDSAIKGLRNLLRDEIIRRNLPPNLLDQIELKKDENGKQVFNVPLWTSENRKQFTDLLFSVIHNKVIKNELPGQAHYVVSSSKYKAITLSDIDQSEIIWCDETYNAEKELSMREVNGVLKSDVLLPQHFTIKGEDGVTRLIDLFEKDEKGNYKWIIEDKNGRKFINKKKFDEKLLQMFSFRIPSSSPSMANVINVVGFIPGGYRDIAVVPKEHIVTLGEDFDIDKRYIYKHYFDYVDGKFRKKAFNVKDVKSLKNSLIDIYHSIYNCKDIEVQKNFHKTLTTKKEEDTKNYLAEHSSRDANRSYFDLAYNMDVMKDGASAQDAVAIYAISTKLHASYERTGGHKVSNVSIRINKYGVPIAEPIDYKFTLGDIQSGNKEVRIGNHKTMDDLYYISDIWNAYCQCAVDNGKLGVIEKANINNHTINAQLFMAYIGANPYTKDGLNISYLFLAQPILRRYTHLMGNNNSIFSASNKASAMKQLLEEFGVEVISDDAFNSMDYSSREEYIKWAILTELKLANEEELITKDGGDLDMRSVENALNISEYHEVSKELTTNKLKSQIEGQVDNRTQLITLLKFMEFDQKGKEVSKISGLLNKPKSVRTIFDLIDLKENLKELLLGQMFENITKTVGDVWRGKNTPPKDYIKVNLNGTEFYIKPTTTEGSLLVSMITAADKLIMPYFPYNTTFIATTLQDIVALSWQGQGNNQTAINELKENIITDLAKYFERSIFGNLADMSQESWSKIMFKMFKDTAQTKRISKNESFAMFIQKLKQSKLSPQLAEFLSYFNTTIVNNKTILKTNLLNKDRSTNVRLQAIFNDFLEDETVIQDNKGNPLYWNDAEPLTYRELAQHFILYSKLSNTHGGAIGFSNITPQKYLDYIGFSKAVRILTALENLNSDDNNIHFFIKQYVQNHIEIVKSQKSNYSENIKDDNNRKVVFSKDRSVLIDSLTGQVITLDYLMSAEGKTKFDIKTTADALQYISTFESAMFSEKYIKFKKSDGEYILFENQGVTSDGINTTWKQVAVLGGFGVSEYIFGQENVTGIDNEGSVIKSVLEDDYKPTTEVKNKLPNSEEESILKGALQELADNQETISLKEFLNLPEVRQAMNSNNAELTAFLESLEGVEDVTVIAFHEDENNYPEGSPHASAQMTSQETSFFAAHHYRGHKGIIELNFTNLNRKKSNFIIETILEEVIHDRLNSEIYKWYNEDLTPRTNDANIPVDVAMVVNLYKKAKEKLQGTETEKSFDSTERYRMTNIYEFAVGILMEDEFAAKVDKEMGTSFIDIVKRAFTNFVNWLFGRSDKFSDNMKSAVFETMNRVHNGNANLYAKYINKITENQVKRNNDYGFRYKELQEEATPVTPIQMNDLTESNEENAQIEMFLHEQVEAYEVEPTNLSEQIRKDGHFEGTPITFDDNNRGAYTVERTDANGMREIHINESLLEEKFREYAWTNPKEQKDGSKAQPLAKNIFKTYDEFLQFVLFHEKEHENILKQDNETIGQYEDRINNRVLAYMKSNEESKPTNRIDSESKTRRTFRAAENYDAVSTETKQKYTYLLNKELHNTQKSMITLRQQAEKIGTRNSNHAKIFKSIEHLRQRKVELEKEITRIFNLEDSEDSAFLSSVNKEIIRLLEVIDKLQSLDNLSDPQILRDVIGNVNFLNEYVTELAQIKSEQKLDDLSSDIVGDAVNNVNNLNNKLEQLSEKLVHSLILNDAELKREMFRGMNDQEIKVRVEQLITEHIKENKGTHNVLDYFSGALSSFAHDLPHIQLLKKYVDNQIMYYKSISDTWKVELTAKANKITEKNGKINDAKFLETKNGELTGNIIDYFTSDWKTEILRFQRMMDNPNISYADKIRYLRDKEVIDFRRIRAIRDMEYEDISGKIRGKFGNTHKRYFSATEEQMIAYEDSLKEKLGVMYDHYINQIKTILQNYEFEKQILEQDDDFVKYEVVAKASPWIFMNTQFDAEGNMLADTSPLSITINNSLGQQAEITFNSDVKNILFIPKDINKYKNETFDSLTDEEVDFWQTLRNVYANYLNPTFNDVYNDDLSYAKVDKTFLESMSKGVKSTLKHVKKGMKNPFFSVSFREAGFNVFKAYTDNTEKDIRNLMFLLDNSNEEHIDTQAKKYNIDTSLNRDDKIYKIAHRIVLGEFSTDLLRATGYLLDIAAQQSARDATAPTGYLLSEANKRAGLNESGENDSISYQKIEGFNKRIIKGEAISAGRKGPNRFLNKSLRYKKDKDGKIVRDSLMQKLMSAAGHIPGLNQVLNKDTLLKLSEAEKAMYDIIQANKDQDYFENDITFNVEMGKQKVRYYYNRDENKYYYIAEDNMGNFDIANAEDVSELEFKEALTEYFAKLQADLGIEATVNGLVNGILQVLIFKGLAFNFKGGMFNRTEGKLSTYKMDATDYYWKTGNASKFQKFVFFGNSKRIVNKVLGESVGKQWFYQIRIWEKFLERTELVQDKRNELDRNINASKRRYNKAGELIGPFAPSVLFPEWKNQSVPAGAVLMDFKIKDLDGNEHSIFDAEKMEFTCYNLDENGNLVLKDEFRTDENINNWENFELDTTTRDSYSSFRHKAGFAIARTQGNYQHSDTTLATSSALARPFMVFKKWMPEHVLSRFSSGEGINFFTGQKNQKGVYITALENPQVGMTFAMVNALTSSFNPLIGLANAGLLGYGIVQTLRNIGKNVDSEIETCSTVLPMFAQILIEIPNGFLNMASRSFRFGQENNLLNRLEGKRVRLGNTLTHEDINNMKYLARELGQKIALVSVLLAVKAAVWGLIRDLDDDDDDRTAKEDKKLAELKKLYNFIQNQGAKLTDTFFMFSNPKEEIDNLANSSLINYGKSWIKLVNAFKDFNGSEILKQSLNVSPIPRNLYPEKTVPYYLWGGDNKVPLIGALEFWKEDKLNNYTTQPIDKFAKGREYLVEQHYRELRPMLVEDIMTNIKRGRKVPNEFKHIDKNQSDAKIKKEIQKIMPTKRDYSTYRELTDKLYTYTPEIGGIENWYISSKLSYWMVR